MLATGIESLPIADLFAPQAHVALAPNDVSVTDGDTIKVHGAAVRLVGFNAPETRGAACARERQLGDRAAVRLRELIATRDIEFASVRCSCLPGSEGTDACNYGRACGTLSADGRDVGAILISEGLAVPYHCGFVGCPRLPRPWCG